METNAGSFKRIVWMKIPSLHFREQKMPKHCDDISLLQMLKQKQMLNSDESFDEKAESSKFENTAK